MGARHPSDVQIWMQIGDASITDKHLIPRFGTRLVSMISTAEFREIRHRAPGN